MDNNDSVADNMAVPVVHPAMRSSWLRPADPDSIANVCEGATRPARSKSPRSNVSAFMYPVNEHYVEFIKATQFFCTAGDILDPPAGSMSSTYVECYGSSIPRLAA